MAGNKTIRLDQLLVDRGLAESKTKAQSLILSGAVQIENRANLKPGTKVDPETKITITHSGIPYVSRGGIKLSGALDYFQISVVDKIVLDIGASTGGFTDCLLQRGAKLVYAVDVGSGQLHQKLRNHPQVVVLEKTNARYLTRETILKFETRNVKLENTVNSLSFKYFDMAVIDVSFISLTKIIPAIVPLLKLEGELIALVKPQFEVPKSAIKNPKLFKRGVVLDKTLRDTAIASIVEFCQESGLLVIGTIPSIIPGPAGNQEYFIYVKKTQMDRKAD
ncbi:MAG: TlyA family RNA methyltransferase [bacterium]|nr:TlyA family RNA methyltransferase [bacterium]